MRKETLLNNKKAIVEKMPWYIKDILNLNEEYIKHFSINQLEIMVEFFKKPRTSEKIATLFMDYLLWKYCISQAEELPYLRRTLLRKNKKNVWRVQAEAFYKRI